MRQEAGNRSEADALDHPVKREKPARSGRTELMSNYIKSLVSSSVVSSIAATFCSR